MMEHIHIITDKATKEEYQLILEHAKPMIFGIGEK